MGQNLNGCSTHPMIRYYLLLPGSKRWRARSRMLDDRSEACFDIAAQLTGWQTMRNQ